jgi:hypothetical protein
MASLAVSHAVLDPANAALNCSCAVAVELTPELLIWLPEPESVQFPLLTVPGTPGVTVPQASSRESVLLTGFTRTEQPPVYGALLISSSYEVRSENPSGSEAPNEKLVHRRPKQCY